MTQFGFWQQLRWDNRDIIRGPKGMGAMSRAFYLFPQGGGPRGPFTFTSFSDLSPHLRSRDVIVLGGVLREQAIAPLDVYDVTIIGAANLPRQATSGGVPTGGGATWMPPASGATAGQALLEIRSAGWAVQGISFTPHTNSAGIRLTRSAVVDTIDASHFRASGCMFAANGGAGQIGIEDNGGSGYVNIEDCQFLQLTGTAIKGLNTAAAVPLLWRIARNRFNANTNAIGVSVTEALVEHNFFRQTANDVNFKVNLIAVAGQGSNNQVLRNLFSDAAANVTIAKGYKPGTGDVWRNWVTDVAADIVTVPA